MWGIISRYYVSFGTYCKLEYHGYTYSLLLFFRCGRLINYMLCYPIYLYKSCCIVILSIIINLFLFIYNTHMFNIYSYYNHFNI